MSVHWCQLTGSERVKDPYIISQTSILTGTKNVHNRHRSVTKIIIKLYKSVRLDTCPGKSPSSGFALCNK